MAVDAVFERAVVEEVVDVDGLGLLDHAGDLDGPGAGLESVGVVGGVGLVGAELVKIVVGAGLGEGGLGIVDGVLAGDGLELVGGVDGCRGIDEVGDVAGGEGAGAECRGSGEEAAAVLSGTARRRAAGVMSEERMVDSRLTDLRRSMRGVPFRLQDCRLLMI